MRAAKSRILCAYKCPGGSGSSSALEPSFILARASTINCHDNNSIIMQFVLALFSLLATARATTHLECECGVSKSPLEYTRNFRRGLSPLYTQSTLCGSYADILAHHRYQPWLRRAVSLAAPGIRHAAAQSGSRQMKLRKN